ncbi:MAG: type II secretion system protein [Candidatus Sungbacteria bacterium]|nr:type II secretion system protein [Candidatus Sungbacteria bacterium]
MNHKKGLTLMEMLIVMTVIGILAAIIVPRLQERNPWSPPEVYALFSGEHELRRMVEREGAAESRLSGSGFFVLGTGAITIEGTTKSATHITFAWKHPHGKKTFVISTMPIEKIQPTFDVSATVPRIRFQLHPNCAGGVGNVRCPEWKLKEWGPQAMIDSGYIVYATLFIREEDWPTKIQLPLSK